MNTPNDKMKMKIAKVADEAITHGFYMRECKVRPDKATADKLTAAAWIALGIKYAREFRSQGYDDYDWVPTEWLLYEATPSEACEVFAALGKLESGTTALNLTHLIVWKSYRSAQKSAHAAGHEYPTRKEVIALVRQTNSSVSDEGIRLILNDLHLTLRSDVAEKTMEHRRKISESVKRSWPKRRRHRKTDSQS